MCRTFTCRLSLGLLVCLSLASAATAQEVKIHDVRVGFPIGNRDYHRAGYWVPVVVEFAPEKGIAFEALPASFQGRLTVESTDSEGAQTRYVVPQVVVIRDDLRADKRRGFLAYTKLGNTFHTYSTEVHIRFDIEQVMDGKGNSNRVSRKLEFNYPEQHQSLVQQNFGSNTVRGDHRFVLALGNVAGLPMAVSPEKENELKYQIAQQTDPHRLPAQWFGYEGVDVIILGTGGDWNGSLAQVVSDTDSLRIPLLQWVAQGGHLVLTVCRNADKVRQSPLAVLYPADIDPGRIQAKAELNELSSYVSSNRMKEQQGGREIKPLITDIVALKEKPPAQASVSYKGIPVIVQSPFGLGRVTMIAFDVDSGTFLDWGYSNEFWKSLLSLENVPDNRRYSYGNEDWDTASKPGMEAASSLATTLEQFGEMPVVSFFLVAIFILGYIVLIGPVDYFFLKKIAKRLEWTWITFPVLVLLVSIGAYLAAYYIKGNEMRLNKVDLVDVDLAHRRVVGNSWVTVFSPNLQKYDLQMTPEGVGKLEGAPCMSWLGRPGTGPRGFDRQQSAGLFRRDYEYGPEAAGIVGVPVQVWGMKTFTSRWQSTLEPGEPQPVETKLTLDSKLFLKGEMQSHLPMTLTDCHLIYKNQYWKLGNLEPGKALHITGSGSPIRSQQDFRPLEPHTLTLGSKNLADFSGPLNDLMYPRLSRSDALGKDRNKPPSYLNWLDQNWRLDQDFEEAVLLGSIENVHGNASDLNANVKVGTKLSTFNPPLRGTLRQATYLRVFLPVEKAKKK